MTFKEWLSAFKGCFYWADARTLHAVNRTRDRRVTEFMLLLPTGRWSGIGLVRVGGSDENVGRTVIEEMADNDSECRRRAVSDGEES